MSEADENKKGPSPPPQEEEEEVKQAAAQAKREAAPQPSAEAPVPLWTGYGRFATVMGRLSKAEFAEAFYEKNALVPDHKTANYNLSAY